MFKGFGVDLTWNDEWFLWLCEGRKDYLCLVRMLNKAFIGVLELMKSR